MDTGREECGCVQFYGDEESEESLIIFYVSDPKSHFRYLRKVLYNSGSYYLNYKGNHFVVLMAVADAQYKLILVII